MCVKQGILTDKAFGYQDAIQRCIAVAPHDAGKCHIFGLDHALPNQVIAKFIECVTAPLGCECGLTQFRDSHFMSLAVPQRALWTCLVNLG